MRPAKLRRNRAELRKEAEANFIPEDAENPFEVTTRYCDRCSCYHIPPTGIACNIRYADIDMDPCELRESMGDDEEETQ